MKQLEIVYYLVITFVILNLTACNSSGRELLSGNHRANRIPVEDFFRRPIQSGYILSPDGTQYIYGSPVDGINNIFIGKKGKDDSVQLTFSTDRDILNFCWAAEKVILFEQDSEGDENFKLYRIDIETGEVRCLTDFDDSNVTIIDMLAAKPEEIIIGLNIRDPGCSDVYRLNIQSGEMVMMVQNPGDVREWMTDNDGVVRIAYTEDVLYRKDEGSPFSKLIPEQGPDDTFIIKYFSPDNKNVYAYSSIGRDRIAIVEYDLESDREVRVLFEDPVYDAFGDDENDHFCYSGSRQELIYALYTAEKRCYYFFNSQIEDIYNSLKESFKGYEIRFISFSDDFNTIIFSTWNDRNEGVAYFYNLNDDDLQLISRATPWLDEEEMAEMRPVTYMARDGIIIHGYLTVPRGYKPRNLPLIVNPHPGPQWRNSWGFNNITQFLANRGYAVLQLNFRGSEGYGKNFLQAGFNQWGRKIQDDITDGVYWLIDQGIADMERVAIFGWSFGGYAALAGITFTPELYACAVDLWGVSNYFTLYNSFPQRHKYMAEINRRWGDAVTDSILMYQVSPVFHVDNIRSPLFIGQSSNDRRVISGHSEQMVEELEKYNKEYEYLVLEGEGHALTNESKTIELMKAIEAFLEKHMR